MYKNVCRTSGVYHIVGIVCTCIYNIIKYNILYKKIKLVEHCSLFSILENIQKVRNRKSMLIYDKL